MGSELREKERRKIEIFVLRHVRASGKISADKGANTIHLCITKKRDTRTGFIAGTHGKQWPHT